MDKLPNVDFSRREVDEILLREIYFGGEAFFCQGERLDSAIKIFHDLDFKKGVFEAYDSNDVIEMSDNKFEKLKRLVELQLEYSTLPFRTVSMEGMLIGYEMYYDKNIIKLPREWISTRQLISFLVKSKEILEYYAKHNITYGDVYNRNILVNKKTGEVKFCDMDNIRIGEFPIDSFDHDVSVYLDLGGDFSLIDAYMHNRMTLSNLKIDIYNPECRRFSKYFLDSALAVVDSMMNPRNFSGEYIVEYVKKKK